MKVELQSYTLPVISDVYPEDYPAYIARIGKVKDNPEKLVKYLIKHKHWSPFEHNFITFKIVTSRAIGRELLRHRSFTFQELSQRYEEVLEFEEIELRRQDNDNRQSSVDVFDPEIMWVPEDMEEYSDKASNLIKRVMCNVHALYTSLLEAGVARETARFILPECTRTTILMTGNLRSWIHFLELRDDSRAQKEAQLIAKEIKKGLLKLFPVVLNAAYEAYTTKEEPKTSEENKTES